MAIQNLDTESQSYIFAFTQEEPAKQAYQLLTENGFSGEKVVLDSLLADTGNIERSQAKRSAVGGAMVGTVLGGLAGLLVSLPTTNLTHAGDEISPISLVGIMWLGSGIGAVALGLIAAITGLSVPKTDLQYIDESKTYQYRVIITGEQEDYDRAQEILQEKGMIANA